MATTKQITELTPAQTLAPTDKLAVAQAAGAEARSATVSQVAAAVAALNEEGALSELVLATSAGKNLLAQRLTEKGVPTSPSETIAQMADKVGGLVVEDCVEVLKGHIGYTYQQITVPSLYRQMAFHVMPNGDKIFWADNKLHYIPLGDYDTFEEFIGAATSEVACVWNKSYRLVFDKNDEYCAVATAADSVNVYKIDVEEQSIVLHKTVALENPINYTSNYYGLNIVSGGRFITYVTQANSSTGKMVAVNVDTQESVVSQTMSDSYSNVPDFCALFETTENTGSISLGKQNYTWGKRLYYQITEEGWSWKELQPSSYDSSLSPVPQIGHFIKVYQPTMEKSENNFRLLRVSIYSPEVVEVARVDLPVIPVSYGSYFNLGLCRNNCVRIWKDGENFKIEILPFMPLFTFNPATRKLTFDGAKNYIPADCQSPFYYNYSFMALLFFNKEKNIYTGFYCNSSGLNPETYNNAEYLQKISFTKDKKITGFRRTSLNGGTYLYPCRAIYADDVESGAMDVQTASLPLSGAEEEEA